MIKCKALWATILPGRWTLAFPFYDDDDDFIFYEPAMTTTKLPLVGWLKFFLNWIELNWIEMMMMIINIIISDYFFVVTNLSQLSSTLVINVINTILQSEPSSP